MLKSVIRVLAVFECDVLVRHMGVIIFDVMCVSTELLLK